MVCTGFMDSISHIAFLRRGAARTSRGPPREMHHAPNMAQLVRVSALAYAAKKARDCAIIILYITVYLRSALVVTMTRIIAESILSYRPFFGSSVTAARFNLDKRPVIRRL